MLELNRRKKDIHSINKWRENKSIYGALYRMIVLNTYLVKMNEKKCFRENRIISWYVILENEI